MNNSLKLKGKYTNAEIFADTIENSVISQTIEILNQKVFENKSIKIMPDVHAGKGCVLCL